MKLIFVLFITISFNCKADYQSHWIFLLNDVYIFEQNEPIILIYKNKSKFNDTLYLLRDVCGFGNEDIYLEIKSENDSLIYSSLYKNISVSNPISINLKKYFNLNINQISIFSKSKNQPKVKAICTIKFDKNEILKRRKFKSAP